MECLSGAQLNIKGSTKVQKICTEDKYLLSWEKRDKKNV